MRPKPLPATPPAAPKKPHDPYSSVPLMSSFKKPPKQYGALEPEEALAASEIFDELPPLPEEHMELCGFSEVFERVVDLDDDDNSE